MGTLIVGAILILIVGLIIRGIVETKKAASHHVAETAATAEGAIENQAYY